MVSLFYNTGASTRFCIHNIWSFNAPISSKILIFAIISVTDNAPIYPNDIISVIAKYFNVYYFLTHRKHNLSIVL